MILHNEAWAFPPHKETLKLESSHQQTHISHTAFFNFLIFMVKFNYKSMTIFGITKKKIIIINKSIKKKKGFRVKISKLILTHNKDLKFSWKRFLPKFKTNYWVRKKKKKWWIWMRSSERRRRRRRVTPVPLSQTTTFRLSIFEALIFASAAAALSVLLVLAGSNASSFSFNRNECVNVQELNNLWVIGTSALNLFSI